MIKQSFGELTEQSSTMTSSKSAGRSSTMLRNGYLQIAFQLWQEEEEEELRKDFNNAWVQTLPINSCSFEQFKDIQEINVVYLALQDNFLLPKGFTEYLHHVGNANELNSMLRNELVPGGKSLKRGRQAVFITALNPMEDVYGIGGKLHATSWNQRIAPYKKTWNAFKIRFFFGAIGSSRKKKACNFTKHSHTQSFSATHCLQLALRKRYVWKLRRTSTKRFAWLQDCDGLFSANSPCDQQDLRSQDSRSFWDPPSESKSYGETWNNAVDDRILRIPILREYGKHNDWSSCDCWAETFVERTVLESELFESLSPCCCHDVPCEQQWTQSVLWSVEELECFKSMRWSGCRDRWSVAENHTEWWICSSACRALVRWQALVRSCALDEHCCLTSVLWSLSVLWPHDVSCMAQVKKSSAMCCTHSSHIS